MTNDMLLDISQLFITFMSAGAGLTTLFYFISYVTNFILGLIFPSRYGV